MGFSINEVYGASGALSIADGKVEHEFHRKFECIFDVVEESGNVACFEAIKLDMSIDLGTSYARFLEFDLFSYVDRITATEKDEDGLGWEIDVDYRRYDPNYNHDNPLDDVPKVGWTFQQIELPVLKTIDKKVIVNSSGDPFDPSQQKIRRIAVLNVQRNEKDFDPTIAWSYLDSVNLAPFVQADPGVARCANISAELQYDPVEQTYWTLTYEFHFNPLGWQPELLDQGINELVGGKRKRIMVDGQPTQIPVLLDGKGGQLPVPIDPTSAVYLTFKIYPELDFSIFNFDNVPGLVPPSDS